MVNPPQLLKQKMMNSSAKKEKQKSQFKTTSQMKNQKWNINFTKYVLTIKGFDSASMETTVDIYIIKEQKNFLAQTRAEIAVTNTFTERMDAFELLLINVDLNIMTLVEKKLNQ